MWEKDGHCWNKYSEDGSMLAMIIILEVSDQRVYMGEFNFQTKIKAKDYIHYLYTEDIDLLKLQMDLVLIKHGYEIRMPGF